MSKLRIEAEDLESVVAQLEKLERTVYYLIDDTYNDQLREYLGRLSTLTRPHMKLQTNFLAEATALIQEVEAFLAPNPEV